MKSALPKPLHEVCGRPMLGYLLDAAFEAGTEKVVVVVGHGKDAVIDRFGDDPRVTFVEQKEQLGTGHAVQVAMPAVPTEGDVIVLAGDLPLIRGESLSALLKAHGEAGAALSLATAELPDPFGYGRVVRDDAGNFLEIVEQLDATPEQREIREVFPSVTCGSAQAMADALGKLSNDNAKGEYYFTDAFHLAREAGGVVQAVKCVGADDIVAPNTRVQLATAASVMQDRIQSLHMVNGVGIADTRTTYIEAGVEIGQDTQILPFTFIGRGAHIGGDCVVGPFAHVPAGGVLKDGSRLSHNASAPAGVLPAQGALA